MTLSSEKMDITWDQDISFIYIKTIYKKAFINIKTTMLKVNRIKKLILKESNIPVLISEFWNTYCAKYP